MIVLRRCKMSFDFEFTLEQLEKIIPGNNKAEYWFDALYTILPEYGITTKRRVAHFLSQCAHESANFRRLEENLNYSAKALNSVFSRYFGNPPKRSAYEYARNPEKIANYVYMDQYRRYKMGNIYEGDGWRFRGRGLKQLTGRDNYTAFGASIGLSAEEAAEYVATEQGAVESACWFWDTNNLNSIADSDDVVRVTKRINGGTNGLEDRQIRYAQAMKILGTAIEDADISEIDDDIGILQRGCRGDGVRILQEALGITADGIFGHGTERALKRWQLSNGLVPDGIAGPATYGVLFDD